MGRIRDKMEQHLVLLGRSAATRESYLAHARVFVKYLGRSPTSACEADVRRWLLYLLRERKLKPATVNVRSVRRLRVSEACGLEVVAIDSTRMVLHVRGTKSGYDRVVPLSTRMLCTLRQYASEARVKGPLLFAGRRGDVPITRNAVNMALRQSARAAGLKKCVHPRLLRHAFATHLVELGTGLRSVQILLGHRALSSTARYTHLSEARRATLRSPLDLLDTVEGRALG